MPRLAYVIALTALCLHPACSRRRREESDHSRPPQRPVAQPRPPAAPERPPSSPPPAAPAPAPTPAPSAPATLQRVIAVGRWPEGISARGNEVWVAESGARSISRVDYTSGAVVSTARAGRLPIRVQAFADGGVQAVSATDQTVWTMPPNATRPSAFARLPDYPQDVAWSDDGTVWALLWQNGTSASGAVARVSPSDGAVTRVATVGASSLAIALGHGRAWVLLRDGVVPIDVATGQTAPTVALPSAHSQMAACEGGVYVGDDASVTRVDPSALTVSGRQSLPGGARAMACDAGGALWVVGAQGQVTKLDGASLAVLSSATPPSPFAPTSARAVNGSLIVATHAYNSGDEAGALLVFAAP